MKKKSLLILGLVALFGLGLVSCKKDCKCEAYFGSNHDASLDLTSRTKKKDCKDYNSTVTDYDDELGVNFSETVNYRCSWGK